MDWVRVHGLEVYGYHGVFPEERKLGQTLGIDLEVGCDLRAAGRTDHLDETLSYVELAGIARSVVEETDYQLIEAVAEEIARRILDLPKALEVVVRVEKPRAPIPQMSGTVSVAIARKKG